jgi:hypothetical protein
LEDVKNISLKYLNKVEKLISYIEASDYFDLLPVKNMVIDCKSTGFSLNKILTGLEIDIPSSSDMMRELKLLYHKDREAHVSEAVEALRHSIDNQTKALEKRNLELEAEVEMLKQDIRMYQENAKAKEEQRKLDRSIELAKISELQEIKEHVEKLQRENIYLREDLKQSERALLKLREVHARETDNLKQELANALEEIAEEKRRIIQSAKKEVAITRPSVRRSRSGSTRKVSQSLNASAIDFGKSEVKMRKSTSKADSMESIRQLKSEIKELKHEKKILFQDNERLMQKVNDQANLERDFKKLAQKSDELTSKFKLKKLECENLWKATKEFKLYYKMTSKLLEFNAIIKKYHLEEKARIKLI